MNRRSRRTIPLDEETTEAMLTHRRLQYEEQRRALELWQDDSHVVATHIGGRVRPRHYNTILDPSLRAPAYHGSPRTGYGTPPPHTRCPPLPTRPRSTMQLAAQARPCPSGMSVAEVLRCLLERSLAWRSRLRSALSPTVIGSPRDRTCTCTWGTRRPGATLCHTARGRARRSPRRRRAIDRPIA